MKFVPIKSHKFQESLNLTIDRIWQIQDRINELEEFDRQWNELFAMLKDRTGNEVKVNILNQSIFKNFRWDKYHVLISDLLSLIENECDNPKSTVNQAQFHLKIYPVAHYIDNNSKIRFIDNPKSPVPAGYEVARTAEIRLGNATRLRENCIEAIKKIYPQISENFSISPENAESLRIRIKDLKQEIYSLRQLFAHKFQDLITSRHSAGAEKFGLQNFRNITETLFDVLKSIGLIYRFSSYGNYSHAYKREISDCIDLILFGSISAMHMRFYEDIEKSEYFSSARKKYYESDKILSIISNSQES